MNFCRTHREHTKKINLLEKHITDIHKHTTIMNSEFGNLENNSIKILKILEGEPGNEDCPGLVIKVDRMERNFKTISYAVGLLITLFFIVIGAIVTKYI